MQSATQASFVQSLSAIPAIWWIPLSVAILFLLVSLRRRREAISHHVRRVIVVESVYVGIVYLMFRIGRTGPESLLAGVLVGVVVDRMIPARSRHIPRSTRRKKIAEYELRTGKKFNPRKHELDHEIPFSRGGGHTEDNLRVVNKQMNRSKGVRSPWWDLFGR